MSTFSQRNSVVSTVFEKGRLSNKKNKKYYPFYIMFMPVLIYYLLFWYGPMFGIIMAFKNYNLKDGIFGSEWVGLDNFIAFFSRGDFLPIMENTLTLSLLRILIGFPAPVILALLIHSIPGRYNKFKRFIQTATYLPHFVSWVVVYGILYNLFSTTGLINQITLLFGMEPISYLGQAKYFRALFVGSAVWKETGWSAIIYIAALSGIDVQLYESAALDGAGRWKQMWHITLPGIRNVVSVMFILALGGILNVGFEQILVMYNSSVSSVAEVLDYYIYRVGLQQANNYSYAAAVGLFRSVIALVMVVIANWGSKKIDEESGIW